MARQTTNYGFNISEGTDLVNPLTDIFPNFESIDTDLKNVSDSSVGTATELLTGTVHALVRADSDRNVFTFTATSNFEAGETFTLDGVQVTALTPDGQTLSTGCYIIGSEVLVAVKGTLMTVYVNPSKALDSDKLDGHDSTYFATASDVTNLSNDVSALSSKVGTGTLTVGNDCVDGINTLNTHFTDLKTSKLIASATIDGSGDISLSNWDNPSRYTFITLSLRSGASIVDAVTIPRASFMGGGAYYLKYLDNANVNRVCHLAYNSSTRMVTLTLDTNNLNGWSIVINGI